MFMGQLVPLAGTKSLYCCKVVVHVHVHVWWCWPSNITTYEQYE